MRPIWGEQGGNSLKPGQKKAAWRERGAVRPPGFAGSGGGIYNFGDLFLLVTIRVGVMPRKRSPRNGVDGAATSTAAPLPNGLSAEDLLDFYQRMVLARTLDERIWALNRQGKVPIAASSQGHEAAELGSLLAAEKDGDCFLFTYYRDLALKFAAGLTPEQVMRSFMGKEGDPYSNGRQFPLQGADIPRNIIQISNVVAAGLTQGRGLFALACRMRE